MGAISDALLPRTEREGEQLTPSEAIWPRLLRAWLCKVEAETPCYREAGPCRCRL